MNLSLMEKVHIKPLLLVEQVTKILTEAIVTGGMNGGDQLIETELQKYFGISRTPLREAFRALEKNGLVVIIPRRGTFVRKLTTKDIDDTFPLLALLEGYAAQTALRRITKEQIDELEEALGDMVKAAKAQDAKAYLDPHVRFHDVYIKASGNDLLAEVLSQLRMRIIWHRYYFMYHETDFNKFEALHRKMIDLFRNPLTTKEEIESCIKYPIYDTYQWVRNYITENADKTEL
jgi:DNA-binding GntR family transcriptional regulator